METTKAISINEAEKVMNNFFKSTPKYKIMMAANAAALKIKQTRQDEQDAKLIAELDKIIDLQEKAASKERARKAKGWLKRKASKEKYTVEILLDSTKYTQKPKGSQIAQIAKELPKQKTTITVSDLIGEITKGRSFKASVLSGTTKDTFVSSNLVALDVDNKTSYTSIDDFIALTKKTGITPIIIYTTFSSTSEHERYRVLYQFDEVITDSNKMDKLYKYVWNLFPTVDIDKSVSFDKILFGGKEMRYSGDTINKTPNLDKVTFIDTKIEKIITKSQPIINVSCNITKEQFRENIKKASNIYKGQALTPQQINECIKLTDVLEVGLNNRFSCIIPSHKDNNPSARIITDSKNNKEQLYVCSCSASGSRLIGLYAKVFEISYIGAYRQIIDLLGAQQVGYEKSEVHIDRLTDESLIAYLTKRNLYDLYLLLVKLSEEKATKVIFASNSYIREQMAINNISGATNSNTKMNELCRLGLIKKLSDSEINKEMLANSKKKAKQSGVKSRIDYYCILDTTPDKVDSIKNVINNDKVLGFRQAGINTQRQMNTHGYEYIRENVHVQGYNKKDDNLVLKSVNALIESGAKFFSEDDINKAIRKRNHKLNKKQASQKILDFMPQIVQQLGLDRTRVNKKTRKQHKIGIRAYASNTVIYIVNEDVEYKII